MDGEDSESDHEYDSENTEGSESEDVVVEDIDSFDISEAEELLMKDLSVVADDKNEGEDADKQEIKAIPRKSRLMEELEKIYVETCFPTYLDICWEFADTEMFLVDGSNLLKLIRFEVKNFIQEYGSNSLQWIFLAEKFLASFQDRGGIFSLVFFSNCGVTPEEKIFATHFKMNTDINVVTEFTDPYDERFEDYVKKFRPSFFLTDLDDFIECIHYLSIGLNIADLFDMTRTVVERRAWYQSSVRFSDRVRQLARKIAKCRTSQSSWVPQQTVPEANTLLFHAYAHLKIQEVFGDEECTAQFYIQMLANIINENFTILQRSKMFPHLFKINSQKFKCKRIVTESFTANLHFCQPAQLPQIIDEQLYYNLVYFFQESGSLDIQHIIQDGSLQSNINDIVLNFQEQKKVCEKYLKSLPRITPDSSKIRKVEINETFYITSHPLHKAFPKNVIEILDEHCLETAEKNLNLRYKKFQELHHWHNLQLLSNEYERIPDNQSDGRSGQKYARFMEKYGTSLEGRTLSGDPIVVQENTDRKQKSNKKSGGALKILLDKLSQDFRSEAENFKKKVAAKLTPREDLLKELKKNIEKRLRDLYALKENVSPKSKQQLDQVIRIEREITEFDKNSVHPLLAKVLSAKFKEWKTDKTDDKKIAFLLVVKEYEKVIKELPTDTLDDVAGYVSKLGFQDLSKFLMKEDHSECSTFLRYQLERMGKHIVKTPPETRDPRIGNFNPDLWQRDIFDAIDARESALIIAPTSSGKTYAAYYAMESVLKESDDGVIVYVSPTKALVNQVSATVCARYSHRKKMPPGRSVYGTFTRDYRYYTMNCQILVTVPECLEILMLTPNHFGWVKKMRYVIFDEIHNIGGESRGECWEHLLSMIRCPMIALSATVQNPEVLLSWLQNLENYKRKMDADLNLEIRKSYTVRLIPKTGKIERHSDLKKYNYFEEDLKPIHPISYLNVEDFLRKGEFPECMTFSPDECLSLIEELTDKFGKKETKCIQPETLFQVKFLDRDNIAELNRGIKTFLQSLQPTKENHENLQSVISKFPGFTQTEDSDLMSLGSQTFMLQRFPKLVKRLRESNMLPVLVFVFDRSLCEKLTIVQKRSYLKEILEMKDSAEYRLKKQKEDKIKKAEKKVIRKVMNKTPSDPDSHGGKSEPAIEEDKLFDIYEYQRDFPNQTLMSQTNTTSQEDIFFILNRLVGSCQFSFVNLFKFGMSYHNAGNNAKMKSSTEMLFRERLVNLVVSTTTLAQGIHMPCKTVVFAGDSVFLNSLNYHQCSGRAGRRGFDTEGNVVFYGIKESKISRLMNSNLPLIFGNSPSSTSLVLKLYSLTSPSLPEADRKDTLLRAYGCLNNSLLSSRIKSLGPQLETFFLYASNFLQEQEFIDHEGHLIGFSGLASHLAHHEPFNFAFCHILQEGVLHSLISRNEKGEIEEDSLEALMTVVSFLFYRTKVNNIQPNRILPPLPDKVCSSLQNFNEMLNIHYRRYINSIARLIVQEEVKITTPLSKLGYMCPKSGAIEPLTHQAGVRDFCDLENLKLTSSINQALMTDTLPGFDIEEEVNGFALSFYKSGDRESMTMDFKIRPGDVYACLNEINLVLKSIETSLKEIGPTDEEENLIEAFTELSSQFSEKFNKAFNVTKRSRKSWGNYKIHEKNCRVCEIIEETDTVESRDRKFKVRGVVDCKSQGCIVLLKCGTCRKSCVFACKQTVSVSIDSLPSQQWSKCLEEHKVKLTITEKLKKVNDRTLEYGRVSWADKLKATSLK